MLLASSSALSPCLPTV